MLLPQSASLWLSSDSGIFSTSFSMVKWKYSLTSQGTSETGFIINLQSVSSFFHCFSVLCVLKRATQLLKYATNSAITVVLAVSSHDAQPLTATAEDF